MTLSVRVFVSMAQALNRLLEAREPETAREYSRKAERATAQGDAGFDNGVLHNLQTILEDAAKGVYDDISLEDAGIETLALIKFAKALGLG